eukprot:139210-Pyramimonas_sp.AAC.1
MQVLTLRALREEEEGDKADRRGRRGREVEGSGNWKTTFRSGPLTHDSDVRCCSSISATVLETNANNYIPYCSPAAPCHGPGASWVPRGSS